MAVFTRVLLALLIATAVAKKKRASRKVPSGEPGTCDGGVWDVGSEQDADTVCAACKYIMHDTQLAATQLFRKGQTRQERENVAREMLEGECEKIAKRKMAQMGERPNRSYINWFEQIGRGMEELTGTLCMGEAENTYIRDACRYFVAQYGDEATHLMAAKRYRDLRDAVCADLAGVCSKVEQSSSEL